MFEFDQKVTIPDREEKILQFWEEKGIFERSVKMREGRPLFSFYDGPPFATGLPHYGHLLAGTLKDVIPRYKTMRGFYVPRRFGWDCHGLPVENEIEKTLELSGAAKIETFGIANFNEECRKIVLRYTNEWKSIVERMGRWVDFDHTYRTMDLPFMESVWWVFQELWKKGLVYEGFKVMPFSMQLGTPLSNFEANLNYKEVDDPSLTVQFLSLDEPNTYFLAWTTTPWTLPSNLALLASPKVTYVKVKHGAKKYILAESRYAEYFKEGEILERMTGEQLNGRRYVPLFPFFEDRALTGAFRIVLDDSVSTDEGTGIVHMAPAFGEIDFYICKRENIDIVCPVDNNGIFTLDVPPYAGMLVKDADKEIIRDLKRQGMVFHQGTVRHRYPFCWRSDTPLIYKAVRTWFVAVEKIKDQLVAANQQITWVPEHIKDGRFGKWLENARDWAISRNRYWGTPIPIWRSEEGDIEVIGSVHELEKLTGAKITDLHRHFIDDLSFRKNGKTYRRIPEVFDCWFESGSMPYAQNHYPFENKKQTEEGFPADFIAEGLDQTRGWFYTLHVLSVILFGREAYKNVIVNGIILAEDGNKMSKRLRNYPDPLDLVDRTGADAMRFYLLQSPVCHGDDLRFSEKGVEQVLRQILIPLWNSFVFLSTYAKIYDYVPEIAERPPEALIDRWILAYSQKCIGDVAKALDAYNMNDAVSPLVAWVEQLTNWYIRRCRSRFWADENTLDRRQAFATLYSVLLNLVKTMAPFTPFLSEAIYQELKTDSMPESVHLCDFPVTGGPLDEELLYDVEAAQQAVSLGHAIRKEYKLKVRQPLASAHLITSNAKLLSALKKQSQVIMDELNVKSLAFSSDEKEFVKWRILPNFPVLGKKIGKLLPSVQKEMQKFPLSQIQALAKGQKMTLRIGEEEIELTSADVQVERQVREGLAAGNVEDLTVVLDTALDDELLMEGLAREIVNKLNSMRRDEDFSITDRICVTMQTTPRVKECIKRYYDLICHEVLAVDIAFKTIDGTPCDLNGEETIIAIQKRP